MEYTHSAKEWFVFYHCQTPTQSGLNIKKNTFCFSSDKRNERVKDKLRAEGFISIRDPPKQEREKIISGKGKIGFFTICLQGKEETGLKKKKELQSLKLYALSSNQKS